MKPRLLRSSATIFAAALALAATAAAAPPNRGSGKGNAPQGAGQAKPAMQLKGAKNTGAECPKSLACRFVPAAYEQNSADPGDYGNYDLANRPADGLAVRFVVIHDTEVSYDGTLAIFENPLAYVSAHYVTRSSDGEVTQMVATKNVAWQAGNWWINTHSVGIENEGFALEGNQWYTDALYHSLASLTRYTADRYGIPLDREHFVGHDQVPGPTEAFQAGMHWDPGPFFDWARFMQLVGAPINGATGDKAGRIVTIDPKFEQNEPTVTACDSSGSHTLPPQPTNFVYVHTAPSEDAPLLDDPLLPGPATTCAQDWGDKAVTGQSFVVAERQGEWIAIWYGGGKAWLHDTKGKNTVAGEGTLVTPRAGLASIPVYGRAYPSSVSTATLGYTIPAGQTYVAKDLVGADYYSASTFNAPETYSVVRSDEKFYEISFNHRLAFVRATDVDVVS
jgi:N-acetyl-anhydromuramyl-L-alanine amidase AmpD